MTQVEEVDAFRALQPVLAVLSPEDRDVFTFHQVCQQVPVKSFGHTLSSLLVSAGLWGCGVNGLGWYVNFRCFLFTLANFPEVLSEKNNIAQTYKDHILKHASMLRNPLYDLVRAADYLEQWVNGLLPPRPTPGRFLRFQSA